MTALLMRIAIVFFASFPADVSGIWNIEMRWGANGNLSTGVCTLKQDDGKLTGTCAKKSSVSGEVRERKLTWSVDVAEDSQKGRMTFEGTLDEAGTTIRGTCAVTDGPTGTFTMKKQ